MYILSKWRKNAEYCFIEWNLLHRIIFSDHHTDRFTQRSGSFHLVLSNWIMLRPVLLCKQSCSSRDTQISNPPSRRGISHRPSSCLPLHHGIRQLSIDYESCTCHQQHPLFVAFNKMVNWSKGLIALNRLVAILSPITFRSWNKSYIQCVALIVCWCSVLLFVVPPIFDVWDTYRMTFIGTCVLDTLPDTSHVYYLLFTFNAYSPIILITTATMIIVGKFARDSPRLRVPIHKSPSTKSQSVMSNRQKRISRMLLISFVLSLTCQLSTYTAIVGGVMVKQPVMALYFFWLLLVQYCASPVSSNLTCHPITGLQNFSLNHFSKISKDDRIEKAIRSKQIKIFNALCQKCYVHYLLLFIIIYSSLRDNDCGVDK